MNDQVTSVIGLKTKEGTRDGQKLIHNGLFESSRVILPEHREAWFTQQEKLMEREKMVLDDQELEQIRRTLIDSYNKRLRIRVMVLIRLRTRSMRASYQRLIHI